MSNRNKDARIAAAAEDLEIFDRGTYTLPDGRTVDIGGLLQHARNGTRLYRPRELRELLDEGSERDETSPPQGGDVGEADRGGGRPHIEVTGETTGAALARRVREGHADVVGLNFASARNPGGGFLGGARAQEEDLALVSGLYGCQLTQPEYYEVNRAQRSMLYTDHIIYAPDVPFFRAESLALLEAPWSAALITAPAPNAGQARRRGVAEAEIEEALHRRAGMVLAVARDQGHRSLVLGAWGCGVFRNVPAVVADSFATWLLDGDRFAGAFDQVTFAILDRHGDTRAPFEARFAVR